MKKLSLTVLALVLFLSLSGLSCSLFSKKTTDTTTTDATTDTTTTDTDLATTNLTNVEATSIDDLVTTNYNLAKSKAQDWKSDAVLVNLTVKLPKNLATNQATETYVFGSAQDANNWFSFSISESSSKYIRAVIPKEDYLGTDVKPVNSTYWKMNYLRAFQLAEANGGKTFRAANKNSEVVTTLGHGLPKGWLWWQMEYKSVDTGNKLIIKVNPNDSTVIDENGNPLSTATAAQ
ncbi:MAG: hypothetical protein ACD_58C00138G0001 [uncultured bacterium]|nr:MAG: hypothetical protein ACD_58C00138G0001 [uncultured bacterium]